MIDKYCFWCQMLVLLTRLCYALLKSTMRLFALFFLVSFFLVFG